MDITLDIAATVSAILWPLALLAILIIYRKQIPQMISALSSRITKLELFGISVDLAAAKPVVMDWATDSVDLRKSGAGIELTSSFTSAFVKLLSDDSTADYAEIDLGEGKEWLTSRLFIMSVLLAREKGIKSFVFVKRSGWMRKYYLGTAEPQKIRWALSREFQRFENNYALAYSTVMSQGNVSIGSEHGSLIKQPGDTTNLLPSISLLSEFLKNIQKRVEPLTGDKDYGDWQEVRSQGGTRTWECAHWIDGQFLKKILGADLMQGTIRASKNAARQTRLLLDTTERFIAVVSEDGQFKELLDRNAVLEEVAKTIVSKGSPE